MKALGWMAALGLLSSVAAGAADKHYTIQDLEALAAKNAWSELIAHLGDVPPAERDDAWTKVATRGAIGAIQAGATAKDPRKTLEVTESLLDRYPQLKESREFMDKRADAGLMAYDRCLQLDLYSDWCGKSLKEFVADDPSNRELAFKAGKLVRRSMKAWFAMPLFRAALEGKADAKRCADPDLKLAVISALGLEASGADETEAVKGAQETLKGECFGELKGAVADEVRGATKAFLRNACPIMKEKKALGKISEKKCEV